MPDFLTPADALARLSMLPSGASVLALGGADTGKTTWMVEAARAVAAQGKTVAVVDTDLGQSEIGPPGTVGVAFAEAGTEFKFLRSLPMLGAAFVGAVSPVRHVPDTLVAAARMTELARARHPHLLLTDTDGWTGGTAARRFKLLLLELLRPSCVCAFGRADEMEPLLSALRGQTMPEVWRIATPPETGRKTPPVRATRRAARFLSALGDAKEIVLPWDAVAFAGTGLGTGAPIAVHVQDFLAQSLKRPVLHAESGPGGLYVVTNGDGYDPDGLPAIETHFRRVRPVQIVPAQKFAGLLVALQTASADLLDIGLLARLDFTARTLTVRTACKRPAAISRVVFGAVRLTPDGREKGETRPGEI